MQKSALTGLSSISEIRIVWKQLLTYINFSVDATITDPSFNQDLQSKRAGDIQLVIYLFYFTVNFPKSHLSIDNIDYLYLTFPSWKK